MDPADNADVQAQPHLDAAIEAIRNKPPVLTPTGKCFNCVAALKVGCFCDGDCRDDWTLRMRMGKK